MKMWAFFIQPNIPNKSKWGQMVRKFAERVSRKSGNFWIFEKWTFQPIILEIPRRNSNGMKHFGIPRKDPLFRKFPKTYSKFPDIQTRICHWMDPVFYVHVHSRANEKFRARACSEKEANVNTEVAYYIGCVISYYVTLHLRVCLLILDKWPMKNITTSCLDCVFLSITCFCCFLLQHGCVFFFYSLCAMLVTCWKKLAFLMRTSLSKIILTLDYGMSVNYLVKRGHYSLFAW